MDERTMIDSLWPRPQEDSNKDGNISVKEAVLFYLKMIPWSIAALLFPVISHAVKKGVTDLLPIAVSIASEVATSALSGDVKAIDFNDKMKAAAIAEGKDLATSEINWLRENAVQIIKGQ